MAYNFFAFVNRMKYIRRWGLMRNSENENLQEHCLQTATIAHMLVLIDNKYFDGKLDPEHAAILAMYHDSAEIITGDLPTPVKYFDGDIRRIYGNIEELANDKLVSMLPDDFKDEFEEILKYEDKTPEYKPYVKAADKISGYIKCVEEESFGNTEFSAAKESTRKAISDMKLKCADYFMDNFVTQFGKPLDEISN